MRMSLYPEFAGRLERVELKLAPPGDLVAGLVQLPMMAATERDSKFVANFDTECSWLRKAKMVWVARVAPADQAWL